MGLLYDITKDYFYKEGLEKGKHEVVVNMLKKGTVSPEQIAEFYRGISGRSEENCKRLEKVEIGRHCRQNQAVLRAAEGVSTTMAYKWPEGPKQNCRSDGSNCNVPCKQQRVQAALPEPVLVYITYRSARGRNRAT
jgi:hypothetical protein